MDIRDLDLRAKEILKEVKQLIDDSIQVRQQSPNQKKQVSQVWQDFIGEFISYLKLKSKETKENLINSINFTSLFK